MKENLLINAIAAFKEYWFKRRLQAEHDKVMKALWNADLTKIDQGKDFLKQVPKMHKYRDARWYLNSFGKICEAYCKEIIRIGVSEEIELSFIRDNTPEGSFQLNTLWYLHHHGHKFSRVACEEIKKCCPRIYYAVRRIS